MGLLLETLWLKDQNKNQLGGKLRKGPKFEGQDEYDLSCVTHILTDEGKLRCYLHFNCRTCPLLFMKFWNQQKVFIVLIKQHVFIFIESNVRF